MKINSHLNLNLNSLKFYLKKNITIQPLSEPRDFNFRDGASTFLMEKRMKIKLDDIIRECANADFKLNRG